MHHDGSAEAGSASAPTPPGGVQHLQIQGDGIQLHVAHAGAGPAVVLLHGFPESWRAWAHQIPALAAAGFSVFAPDLRGYHDSDNPAAPGAYHIRRSVADVVAIIRASGHARAHVVGHDWGGMLAWVLAWMHPELVERLVIVGAPHPAIYRRHLRGPTRQLFRSWYVLLFRIPWLAERVLSMFDFAVLRDMFRRHPARPAFSAADIDATIAALARPGRLTAALRWYRDNAVADAAQLLQSARTAAPTLVLWGEHDAALGIELLEGLEEYAPAVRVHVVAGVSHWIQNEAPDEVNRAILEFLAEPSGH